MKLSLDTEEAIIKHALSEYPNEACGVIKGGKYYSQKNIHEQPLNNFRIDDKVMGRGDVEAIVHSHTNGRNWPSLQDLRGQYQSGLPWIIVCTDGKTVSDLFSFGDEPPPLIGRVFRFGVTDCYTLIRDYYKEELGLRFSPFFYDGSKNPNDYAGLYERHLIEYGFTKKSVPQRHDILTFTIGGVNAHGGIYLGDGQLLHHLEDRLSRIESAQNWIKNITGIYRYEA